MIKRDRIVLEKPVSGEERGSVSCKNEELLFIDDSYDMFIYFVEILFFLNLFFCISLVLLFEFSFIQFIFLIKM